MEPIIKKLETKYKKALIVAKVGPWWASRVEAVDEAQENYVSSVALRHGTSSSSTES